MAELEIGFDLLDQIGESEANELINELASAGASAKITKQEKPQGAIATATLVALIAVTTASVSALSVVASFFYKTFRRGVVLNLKESPPKIEKNISLPLGSLLIIFSDGREEYHESISGDKIGELMATAISSTIEHAEGG